MAKHKMQLARTREATVAFLKQQLEGNEELWNKKHRAFHYGKVELRELLDFIYNKEPTSQTEKL